MLSFEFVSLSSGIGLIQLSLVDRDKRPVVAQPYFPSPRYEAVSLEEHHETLNSLLNIEIYNEDDDGDHSDDNEDHDGEMGTCISLF